ncbi:MAG: hypothetical protein COB53_00245 [Elusimicrobia bacterium]|nr:MAG: hypothetical protein COB53_00245 [Elusimicrobiota bacterium]
MKKIMAGILLSAFMLPGISEAKRNKELPTEPIHILEGEVHNEDIATKGPVTIDGIVNADVTSFGEDVIVRGEVNGDVVAMGGMVEVTGRVNGDVVGLGAPVMLSGHVSKDLVVIGEEMTITSGAVVAGDVSVIGGDFNQSDGAIIKGDVSNIGSGLISMMPGIARKIARIESRDGSPLAFPSKKFGFFGRAFGFVFAIVVLVGCAGILMLMGMLVPEPIERMSAAIKTDFWKAVGMGFLVAVAFVPGLLFLTVSIVGLPLVPLAMMLLFGVTLMGLASFSILLSERLHASRKSKMPDTIPAIGLGFLVLNALFIVGKAMGVVGGPFATLEMLFFLTNMMLFSGAILLGLGAAVMTKMGTKEYVLSK